MTDYVYGGSVTVGVGDARYIKQDGTTALADGQVASGDLTVTGAIDANTADIVAACKSAIQWLSEVTITGTANIGLTDGIVLLDASGGAVSATLPAASTAFSGTRGLILNIKRIDSSGNAATVSRAGADTIDGGTSVSFSALQAKRLIATSATTWGVF